MIYCKTFRHDCPWAKSFILFLGVLNNISDFHFSNSRIMQKILEQVDWRRVFNKLYMFKISKISSVLLWNINK